VFGIFFDVKRKAFLFRIVDQFIYTISIFVIVICYICRIMSYDKEISGVSILNEIHTNLGPIFMNFFG
jgi:hypothetical protein